VETVKPTITIGVDPEIILIDTQAGRYCSAHGLVPGTKEAPHPLNKGAVQLDGAAVEYNITPAATSMEFIENNTEVMRQIREMIPKHYEFTFEPSVKFDKFYFDKLVPEDVKVLGCSPDFNAFTKKINPPPKAKAGFETMRTCSGHIHIGWTKDANPSDPSHMFDCEHVIKALEGTVGHFLKLWDKDTDRANLYGKPGAFRYKPYGVEWRTPSNAWLKHPEIWGWLFDAVKHVVEELMADRCALPGGKHLIGVTITGKNAKQKNIQAHVNKYLPNFPVMPTLAGTKTEEEIIADPDTFSDGTPIPLVGSCVAKAKKSSIKVPIAKRLSPTSTTTTFDINLDIPGHGQEDLPLPAYLTTGEQYVHPSKDYGLDDDF
jgi:hypothetical protein